MPHARSIRPPGILWNALNYFWLMYAIILFDIAPGSELFYHFLVAALATGRTPLERASANRRAPNACELPACGFGCQCRRSMLFWFFTLPGIVVAIVLLQSNLIYFEMVPSAFVYHEMYTPMQTNGAN